MTFASWLRGLTGIPATSLKKSRSAAHRARDTRRRPSAERLEERTVLAADANFSAAQNFAVGAIPFAVAVGDFNSDGKLDLASANINTNDVSVLLGNGNGTFQTQQTFAAGGDQPCSVAVGDFNVDGKPDLVVTNFLSSSVSVLRGNGDGTFQTPQTFAVVAFPKSVVVADFNTDGKPDLAVGSNSTDGVSVLLGNGDGTLQTQQSYAVPNGAPALAVTDFNADGKPDLAVAGFGVSVFLGNGDGTFQGEQHSDPFVSYIVSTAVGDFNGDGRPDLVNGNYDTSYGSISGGVLLGNGNGTFQPEQYVEGYEFNVESVAVADFNGDGKADVALASEGVTVHVGNGDGTFQVLPAAFDDHVHMRSIAVGDFNGDGQPDLAFTDPAHSSLGVLLNTSKLIVTGTAGNDAYSFSAHSSGGIEVFRNGVSQGHVPQVVVADPGGSDSYTVNFGGWTGNVTLNDTGATGGDTLIVNGTAADESLDKLTGFVQWKLAADPTFQTRVDFTGFGNAGDAITLNAAAGNDSIHDPGSNTTILGGPGDDTITIDATAGNGVVIDGGDGSDTYIVQFGNLAGPVTVSDSGTTGVDSLEVDGTAGNDTISLAGNEVQRGAEHVIIAAPLDSLTVSAGDGADSITVGDVNAPIDSLTLDGGAGANQVNVTASLPAGLDLEVLSATQIVDANIHRKVVDVDSHGLIAVVLYSTPTFNASKVKLSSVVFAGAHVAKSRLQDVDCDGDLDLVLKFRTQETKLLDVYAQLLADADQTVNGKLDKGVSTRQQATLPLTGETVDGLFFQGFDTLDLFLEGKELKELLHDLAAARKI